MAMTREELAHELLMLTKNRSQRVAALQEQIERINKAYDKEALRIGRLLSKFDAETTAETTAQPKRPKKRPPRDIPLPEGEELEELIRKYGSGR